MTFPAITVLNTHMIGDESDGFLNIWNFWFIKEKIIKGDLDIYHTNLQFYPIGTRLFFHTFALTWCFLSSNLLVAVALRFILG
jgi:hypothetical protein